MRYGGAATKTRDERESGAWKARRMIRIWMREAGGEGVWAGIAIPEAWARSLGWRRTLDAPWMDTKMGCTVGPIHEWMKKDEWVIVWMDRVVAAAGKISPSDSFHFICSFLFFPYFWFLFVFTSFRVTSSKPLWWRVLLLFISIVLELMLPDHRAFKSSPLLKRSHCVLPTWWCLVGSAFSVFLYYLTNQKALQCSSMLSIKQCIPILKRKRPTIDSKWKINEYRRRNFVHEWVF